MSQCPSCGADLDPGSAGGLCPRCLLAGAFDTDATRDSDSELSPGAPDTRGAAEDDRFGPYRILHLIGEGGMGSVYLAEQTQPIRRQVALKVIKLGMDTRQVAARFETERQALAMMDHPNIARVFDAGTSDRGRPYFAMEYVVGEPITRYCDRKLLDTRARLELFGPVCAALQHAHQKGVIHRDIKPSNVLVAEQDGVPFPKVIDFGIAKATDQRLAENTAFTMLGRIAGTPEYMSPEQADLGSRDIDTTTDVYSLGVLLYELLVGALPFDGRWLREAGLAELLRIIREEEPPTPSAKLTRLGETATEIARSRGTDPVTLRRQLAGDLNWIVMKSLEKDRRRRYPSVSELAADIRRHLEDQPVLASPPGRIYRTRKFVRRHKVSVSAGVLVAASLVAGLIAVSWEARVAESRRREAEVQRTRADGQTAQAVSERGRAEQKTREAEAARLLADVQRKDAEDLFGSVRDLANSMIFEMADQIADLQGATAARETLLRKAVEYLDRLSKDPRATPELRRQLGEGYMKIGDLQGRSSTGSLNDPKGALASYDRSRALLEPLLEADPKNTNVMHDLIHLYMFRSYLRDTAVEAQADYARARALAERQVAIDPNSSEARRDLATVGRLLGMNYREMPPEGEREILQERAVLEESIKQEGPNRLLRSQLADTYLRQGYFAAARRDPRALDLYDEALGRCEALAREFPYSASIRGAQATALEAMAEVLRWLNRTTDAIERLKQSIALRQDLARADERNAVLRLGLIRSQMTLAELLIDLRKRAEADEAMRACRADLDRLLAGQPANPEFRKERALTNTRQASLAWAADNRKSAMDQFRSAEAEMSEIVRQNPDRADFSAGLAQVHGTLAAVLLVDDPATALDYNRRALAESERAAAGKPPVHPAWSNVAYGHVQVARAMARTGDLKAEAGEYGKAITIYERLEMANPGWYEYLSALSRAHIGLAGNSWRRDDWHAVLDHAGKAQPFLEARYTQDPTEWTRVENLASALRQMAEASDRLGDFAGAIEIRRRLVRMREQFAVLDPSSPERARLLSLEFYLLAQVLRDAGDRQGTLDADARSTAVLDRFPPETLQSESLRRNFGFAYFLHGWIRMALFQPRAAVEAVQKSLVLWGPVRRGSLEDGISTFSADLSHRSIALVNLVYLGNPDEALRHYGQALEMYPAGSMDAATDWNSAGYLQSRVAWVQGVLGDRAARDEGLRKAIELDQRSCEVAQQERRSSVMWRDLAWCEEGLAQHYLRLGETAPALEHARKAAGWESQSAAGSGSYRFPGMEADAALLIWQNSGEAGDYRGLAGSGPATPQQVHFLVAHGYGHLASSQFDDGLWQQAVETRQKSLEMFEELLREAPANRDYRLSIAVEEQNVGENYLVGALRPETPASVVAQARLHLARAHRMALELEQEHLLPAGYIGLPGQIRTDLAACEGIASK
jgi:serine/threonine protein kinase/tetratricopeptide (TPR) repeat protein